MISRKLIDWVKSEEAKGLNDTQVKKILIQKGWPVKDIELAVNLAHKKKVNWMPVLLVFGISLVFLILFLVSLGTHFEEGMILSFIGLVFLIIYSYIFYHKTNHQESFIQFFIINFASMASSLLATIFLFNMIVCMIYLMGAFKITVVSLILIFSLCVIFFYYVYYSIMEKLLKHFQGYFDYEAYFIYKHWPFKLLNINWNQKWTLLKYPIIIIVIGLLLGSVMYSEAIKGANRSGAYTISSVQEQLKQQLGENCHFVLDEYSPEELVNCPFFSEEQLKLEVVQKVNQERQDLYLGIFHKEFSPITWTNYIDGTISKVTYFTELGLNLGYAKTQWDVVNSEFDFIENKSITFYDGTPNLKEYNEKLNSNIDQLYPQFLAITPQNAFWEIGGFLGDQPYSYKTIFSVEESFNYLMRLWFQHPELELKINNLRNNFAKDKIKSLYNTKEVVESPESKALRLKIIETLIANELAENCQYLKSISNWDKNEYNSCIVEITDVTHSPDIITKYA